MLTIFLSSSEEIKISKEPQIFLSKSHYHMESLVQVKEEWDLTSTAAAKSLQSCPTLCDPIDGSLPGSSVPVILHARILEWAAISLSNAWKWKVKREVAQLCPNLCDPIDGSLPGSSVHGIFQARILEWGDITFSGRRA